MRRSLSELEAPWIPLIVLGTLGVVLLDVAKKTVFLGASWNYDYPDWTFVYDPFALGALIVVSVLVIASFDRLADLDRDRFLLVLLASTIVISALAFFATPEKSYKWALTPDTPGPVESFQYHPSTIAAEEGIQAFFSEFHSAPTRSGSDRLETTRYLTEQLREAEYLPWNDAMADYASKIVTQRHGPVPGLLVAPFLFVLGTSPESAVIGSYAITVTLPVLTYFLLQPYFDERSTRLGTLFVLFAPAFLIYQRYGTVSYDAITAVVVTAAMILFLNACRTDRRRVLALSGIVFSGAMLSKISILTVFGAFLLLLVVYEDTVRDFAEAAIVFGSSTLVVPIALLPLGYNFVVQYMYDIARILKSDGGSSTSFVMSWLISIYNVRLLGAVVLAFLALFLVALATNFDIRELDENEYVSTAFVVPMLPFFALTGITLSRHLLPLLPMVVFAGLSGISLWYDRELRTMELQIVLGATLLLALVNI